MLEYRPSSTGCWAVRLPTNRDENRPVPPSRFVAAPDTWKKPFPKTKPAVPERTNAQLTADKSIIRQPCDIGYCPLDPEKRLHAPSYYAVIVQDDYDAEVELTYHACQRCVRTAKKTCMRFKVKRIEDYHGDEVSTSHYTAQAYELLLNNGAYGCNMGTILVDYLQHKSDRYLQYLADQYDNKGSDYKPGHGNVYISRLKLLRKPPPPPVKKEPPPTTAATAPTPETPVIMKEFVQVPPAKQNNSFTKGNNFIDCTPRLGKKYIDKVEQLCITQPAASGPTNAAFQYFFSQFGSLSTFTSNICDLANYRFHFCGKKYGFSTTTAARLINAGHDKTSIFQLANTISFFRHTCKLSVSTFYSSICAGSRNKHAKHNFFMEGWLDCNILDNTMLMNFAARVFIPKRIHGNLLGPLKKERLPQPRNNIFEMIRYRGKASDFVLAGEFDFENVLPHGTTPNNIPYIDFNYDFSDDKLTHRALLNRDESCGKHTLEYYGEKDIPDGPTSIDDLRSFVPNFDEQYEVIDTEKATSLNPDGPTGRKKIAYSKIEKDDKPFWHWSPLIPRDEENPKARSVFDIKAAHNQLSEMLKGHVTVPAKLDFIPTVTDDQMTTTLITNVSNALLSIVSIFAFTLTGLNIIPDIKNIFTRITSTPYVDNAANREKIFWNPVVDAFSLVSNLKNQRSNVVIDTKTAFLPQSYFTTKVTVERDKMKKPTKWSIELDSDITVQRNHFTVDQETALGSVRTTVIDTSRRIASAISTWITRLDYLKSVNDIIKLYAQKSQSVATIAMNNPTFSIALKRMAENSTHSFLPYVLNHFARYIQSQVSMTSGVNNIFHDTQFNWSPLQTRKVQGKFFPTSNNPVDKVLAWHIPAALFIAEEHPDIFTGRDLLNIVYDHTARAQLRTRTQRRNFLLATWRPALNSIVGNDNPIPANDNEAILALTDLNSWIVSVKDSTKRDAARSLIQAHKFFGVGSDFLDHGSANGNNFPITVAKRPGYTSGLTEPVPLTEYDYQNSHRIINKAANSLPFPLKETTVSVSAVSYILKHLETSVENSAELYPTIERLNIPYKHNSLVFVDVVPSEFGARSSRASLSNNQFMNAYRIPYNILASNGATVATGSDFDLSTDLTSLLTDSNTYPQSESLLFEAFNVMLTPEEKASVLAIIGEHTYAQPHTNLIDARGVQNLPFAPRFTYKDQASLDEGATLPNMDDSINTTPFSFSADYTKTINDVFLSATLDRGSFDTSDLHVYDSTHITVPIHNFKLFVYIAAGVIEYDSWQERDLKIENSNIIGWQLAMASYFDTISTKMDKRLATQNVPIRDTFYPHATNDEALFNQRLRIVQSDSFIWNQLRSDFSRMGMRMHYPLTHSTTGTQHFQVLLASTDYVVYQRNTVATTPILPVRRSSFNFKNSLVMDIKDASTIYRTESLDGLPVLAQVLTSHYNTSRITNDKSSKATHRVIWASPSQLATRCYWPYPKSVQLKLSRPDDVLRAPAYIQRDNTLDANLSFFFTDNYEWNAIAQTSDFHTSYDVEQPEGDHFIVPDTRALHAPNALSARSALKAGL